jgi:hypothetical protein
MGNPFIKKYSATVEIKASPELVWKTILDFPNYHLWNSFTPKMEVDWKIGGKVVMTVQMKKCKKPIMQTEYLSKINTPHEFAYGINWGIFLKAERVQSLRKANGHSIYFTEDVIEGLMCPIVHLIYGKSIKNGFERVAQGLKNYMEKQ